MSIVSSEEAFLRKGSTLPQDCFMFQVLLDDMKEAVRTFSRSLTAAMAFIDSRQMGMMALLDRQAKELLKKIQVWVGNMGSKARAPDYGLFIGSNHSGQGTGTT